METRWIVIPYDRSVVSRLTLQRAVHAAQSSHIADGGVLLAVGGMDASILPSVVEHAGAAVGDAVRIEAFLIGVVDPMEALHRMAMEQSDIAMAAPVGTVAMSGWYAKAAWAALSCRSCPVYAFHVDGAMVKEAEENEYGQSRIRRFVGTLLHGGSGLRPGMRPAMRGVSK